MRQSSYEVSLASLQGRKVYRKDFQNTHIKEGRTMAVSFISAGSPLYKEKRKKDPRQQWQVFFFPSTKHCKVRHFSHLMLPPFCVSAAPEEENKFLWMLKVQLWSPPFPGTLPRCIIRNWIPTPPHFGDSELAGDYSDWKSCCVFLSVIKC